MEYWIYSAFIVGLLGSFHCAGMCGPIALALPLNQVAGWNLLFGRLLYNAGRVFSYSLLGFVVGIAGHTISLAGYQGPLSVASGILILIAVFLPFIFRRVDTLKNLSALYGSKMKDLFRALFGKKSKITMLFIGAVNGFLPCGFVYLALAGAIASGSLTDSILYMTFFGMGTIPMMLTLSMVGKFGGPRLGSIIHRASPYIAVSVAILLIIRGLMTDPHACCH